MKVLQYPKLKKIKTKQGHIKNCAAEPAIEPSLA
jgi:hypothetical protein